MAEGIDAKHGNLYVQMVGAGGRTLVTPRASSLRETVRAVALGHYVSFTGILTFKNSQPLRDIAAELPADRILVETDAPYLAPNPHRGKRNEPSFVTETARTLAGVRGVSTDEIARQTTDNFFRLFSKVPREIGSAT